MRCFINFVEPSLAAVEHVLTALNNKDRRLLYHVKKCGLFYEHNVEILNTSSIIWTPLNLGGGYNYSVTLTLIVSYWD